MSKEVSELRNKSVADLEKELIATREDQFNLRMKHRTGQLNETNNLAVAKKKIARIKTLITEKKVEDSK